jgi:hypothetical protein
LGNTSAIVHAYFPYEKVEDYIHGQIYEDGTEVDLEYQKSWEEGGKEKPYITFSLNTFGLSMPMVRKIIGMIQNISIQRNVDVLYNSLSSNYKFLQM